MIVDYDIDFDTKVDKISKILTSVGFERREAIHKARLLLLEKMREDRYRNDEEHKSYVLKDDNLISTAAKVSEVVNRIRRYPNDG